MKLSSYPPGTERDPNAPWNQSGDGPWNEIVEQAFPACGDLDSIQFALKMSYDPDLTIGFRLERDVGNARIQQWYYAEEELRNFGSWERLYADAVLITGIRIGHRKSNVAYELDPQSYDDYSELSRDVSKTIAKVMKSAEGRDW